MTRKQVRCQWGTGVDETYQRYHDQEWGVPVHDEHRWFEFLILEGAQAGLSWSTVLNKREGYRRAFAQFDPVRVARFTPKRIEKLLTDPSIIRNRLKVQSAVTNARAFLAVQDELASFDNYMWAFVEGKPKQNRWRRHDQVPATSAESPMSSAEK